MTITLDTRITALSLTADNFIDFNGSDVDTTLRTNNERYISDATIESIINTVGEFVFANAPSTCDTDLLKSALKQLVSDEFNNRLFKFGLLPNWTPLIVMDQDYITKLLSKIEAGVEPGLDLFIQTNVTEW